MKKRRQDGQEKRVRRRDRFHRIKNKQEQVYKSPAFFNGNLGVSRISESGIFEVEHCFTKAYCVTELQDKEWEQLIVAWRESGTECGILQGKYLNETYLLLREGYCDISEAIEKFAEMERKLKITGLSTEQRIERYCNYISKVLGGAYPADSYLSETPAWKEAASMNKLRTSEKEIAAEAGYFAVMAIRRFPGKIKRGMLRKLADKEYCAASYLSALRVTDKRIRESVEEEYLGVDGVLPRMKRKAPLLYDILKNEDGNREDTGSFMSASAYFLLHAETLEELYENMSDFSLTAGENGIRTEKIPLAELKRQRELKETLAMFGLMGNCQKRYGNFLPADDTLKLLVYGNAKEEVKGQAYDVEEMRALFFGENGRREEKGNEQK